MADGFDIIISLPASLSPGFDVAMLQAGIYYREPGLFSCYLLFQKDNT
jgi:hypothetical protein